MKRKKAVFDRVQDLISLKGVDGEGERKLITQTLGP